MIELNNEYWTNRYQSNEIGWDIGQISAPLKEYFDQLTDTNISILIPGAGNAYEAEYLFKNGFKYVTILDISTEPLRNIKKRIPEFPESHLVLCDFFEHKGQYDLIIEQTFFCAIYPSLRLQYAHKMYHLLKPKSRLVGLLFNAALNASRPPFGGCKEEYIPYFKPFFNFKTFEPCYNSIKPRENRELFVNFEKL